MVTVSNRSFVNSYYSTYEYSVHGFERHQSYVGIHSSSNHTMCSSVLYNLHLLFLVIPSQYLFCCKYKYAVPYYMTAVSDKVLLFNVVHKEHNIY
jgi:hypothetical protein